MLRNGALRGNCFGLPSSQDCLANVSQDSCWVAKGRVATMRRNETNRVLSIADNPLITNGFIDACSKNAMWRASPLRVDPADIPPCVRIDVAFIDQPWGRR
jgi:hypothetical protein